MFLTRELEQERGAHQQWQEKSTARGAGPTLVTSLTTTGETHNVTAESTNTKNLYGGAQALAAARDATQP
jgi:hypothetical protein